MKKKTATRTQIRAYHAPHFYILFAVVMIVAGAFAALVAQKVIGQTANNAIYACAQKQTGNLRMVAQGTSCRPDEQAVSWSIQGPQGEQGLPGSSSSNGLPYTCYNCALFPYADKIKGKDFSNAQIKNTEFYGADLTAINFKGAYLDSDGFDNTNLTNADFSNQAYDVTHSTAPSSWGYNDQYLQFENANLSNVTFANSGTLHQFDFKNANMLNVNFSNDTIQYTSFKGAQNMSSANVSGVTWTNDTCPDGTNSNNDGNTCAGHF